ncbi:unnamed protein product [Closterium sp. Yama58-4]|nr:unnamed protein product [Closterium sp. Yama58-4]
MARGNPRNLVPPAMMHTQSRPSLPRLSKDNHKYFGNNAVSGDADEADDAADEVQHNRWPTGARSQQTRRGQIGKSPPPVTSTRAKDTALPTAKNPVIQQQPIVTSASPVEASPAGSPERSGERRSPGVATEVANVDAAVVNKPAAATAGKTGAHPMELAMTRAIGEAYTTKATIFREEGRQHLEVNDELQLKADDQEKQNGELRKELQKREADLKDALELLKHLAEKIADDQLAKVNWRVHIKESCDDFLFKPDTLNLSPDPDAMLAALIKKAGYIADSPQSLKLAALLKVNGILKHACVRFNDQIGKIYHFCRLYAMSLEPCVFLQRKRNFKGEVVLQVPEDLLTKCADYLERYADKFLGIPWHVNKRGSPFSSPAFVKCASLWDSSGALPIGLFPVQLLVILAAVRFKFRHPSATKAQLDRSRDPGALARQARVVQRWINSSDVTCTDGCLGIGKICIVGWKEIPEEELVADEHGDLGLDELVSEPGTQERVDDENEEQVELFG